MLINENIINYKADAMQNKLEKLFSEFFAFNKNISINSSTPWQPPTDVYETPNEVVVKMSISGTKSEDINIAFLDGILTISGCRTDTSLHEKTCFYQVEIRYGQFERNLAIPIPIDTDNIRATYKDGFLQVVLPKAKQQVSQKFLIKINFHQ
ncbi:MAG: Hsp20/alpha crystallin family protein [Planctomycetota bacterium]|nr:Hsp20/alpha crystallin family protein [Planctomycetota bacterium]MDE1890022.1 Hsp20/alpha crystallin family protein [Planctomycetota bacterium]MDE2216499.1 Hsp20/alpha crystallin family protein [Planctomycetota bacterium]